MKRIFSKEDEVRLYKIVAQHLQLKTWKFIHPHYVINNRLIRERMDISFHGLATAISKEFNCAIDTSELRESIKNNFNMSSIIKLINGVEEVKFYTGGTTPVKEEIQYCILKVNINDKISYFTKNYERHYFLQENREDATFLPYSHVNRFMGDDNILKTNKFVNNLHQQFIEVIRENFDLNSENSITVEILMFEQLNSLTSTYNKKEIEAIEILATEKNHLEYLKSNMEEDVLKYLRFKGIDV